MSWPCATGLRSTSIGAPAAIVAASGFIWEINGQSVATPPTAAAAPVATKRKTRRVGLSAEDAVVTFPHPFLASQPVEPLRIRSKALPGRSAAPAAPAAADGPPFSARAAKWQS